LNTDGGRIALWASQLIKVVKQSTKQSSSPISKEVEGRLLGALKFVASYEMLSESECLHQLKQLPIAILPSGYKGDHEGHSICFVLGPDFVDITNRGLLARTQAIESYATNTASISVLRQHLLKRCRTVNELETLLEELRKLPGLKRTKEAPQEKYCLLEQQKAGTCSFASLIAAVWSLLVHEMGAERAKPAFNEICTLFQLRSLSKLEANSTVAKKHFSLFKQLNEELAQQKVIRELNTAIREPT
jgi:hypothetical protein